MSSTSITLPDDLRKRIEAVAQSLNVDAEILAIGAVSRLVEKLEDDERTREAIAHQHRDY